MTTTLRTRTAALVSAGAIGLLVLSGCSGTSGSEGSSEAESSSSAETSAPASEDTMADSALVGPGCAAYAEQNPDGAGSVEGMAKDPVATAASNNPMLSTLTDAVSGKLNPDVNLVDTLNGDEFTVIAPINEAFDKIPKKDLEAVAGNADELTKVLTYHVIPGQLSPDEIVGEQETVEGSKVKIAGSGDDLTFDDAKLVCGGVKTANATVYMVDSVLMPPK